MLCSIANFLSFHTCEVPAPEYFNLVNNLSFWNLSTSGLQPAFQMFQIERLLTDLKY